ncbi:MAG: Lon protease mitochondrial, partial [Paramarteilia canceri]
MEESVSIALTVVKAYLNKTKNEAITKLESGMLHIHVPEGGIPKDGPSAGITMASALLSNFTGASIPKRIAMTGELSLSGKVLAVGGIREKLTAAKRENIDLVILPKATKLQYEDIPKEVHEGMDVKFVDHIDE